MTLQVTMLLQTTEAHQGAKRVTVEEGPMLLKEADALLQGHGRQAPLVVKAI